MNSTEIITHKGISFKISAHKIPETLGFPKFLQPFLHSQERTGAAALKSFSLVKNFIFRLTSVQL